MTSPSVKTAYNRSGNARQTVTLDFASKGLTDVELKPIGKDEGEEARLRGTAMFSPTPEWPLGHGQRSISDKIEFPVKVNFRIAMNNFPEAISTFGRNIKIYLDMLDNGYDWHEKYIAMWNEPEEGIWAISLYQGAITLPEYWAVNIQPRIKAAEAKWQTNRWKRRRLDSPTNFSKPKPSKKSSSNGHLVGRGEDRSEKNPGGIESPKSDTAEQSPLLSRQANDNNSTKKGVQRFDISDLRQELMTVANELGDAELADRDTSTVNTPTEEHGEVTEEQALALAGGQSSQGEDSAEVEGQRSCRHFRRRTSMEQEEADRLEVEQGWLHAVELLIQLADCLLAFHERRLSLEVCRPEYFSVYPKPFKPKSSVISDEQPVSLDLVRTSAIVPLSGYQNGKVVSGMNGDFDGDRVIASGPGAGVFAPAESLTRDTTEKADLSAVGALEGTFDEEAIRRHLRYIAPEAISDKKAIGSVVDIFSWGVAAYELITGRQIENVDDAGPPDLLRDIHLHSVRPVKPILGQYYSIPPELCDIVKKSVSLDPDDRYSNMCAVLHDLHKTKEICQGKLMGKARREYDPGYIDVLSRFLMPPGLMDRTQEHDQLDKAYQNVKTTGNVGTVCCWGPSGSGKSRLLEVWARKKEASNAGQECLVGWAKMDQQMVRPLSAFVAVFTSLLDRVFSDPLENPDLWRKRIGNALSVNGNVFLSLIPSAYRNLLLDREMDTVDEHGPLGIDWDRYVQQFRSWSYGLLQLFGTKARPLIIVLDDYQWIGAEQSLWEDLILHPMRHLDNTLLLLTFRTPDRTPPDLSPFVDAQLIEARPFSRDVLQSLVLQCFHFDHGLGNIRERITPQWTILVDFLYDATKGNPFYNKMILTALVRDGVVYFDYRLLKWIVKVEQLDRYSTTGVVAFVTNTLNSLSDECREVLRVLACLPSRGVHVNLLSDLVQKPATIVRTLLDEAATLGSIQVTRQEHVQFNHDRHHQAALSLITQKEKAKLYVTIAEKLEDKGDEYIFARADLIMEATVLEPECYPIPEKSRIITEAAKRASRVAALGLAEKYLQHIRSYADFSSPQLWKQNPRSAMELTILQGEVAMALRQSAKIIPEIVQAREQAPRTATKINISTLLFRLNVGANAIEAALHTLRETFFEIGINVADPTVRIPTTPKQVHAIIDEVTSATGPDRQSPQDEIAIAIAKLCLTAGATIYSYSTNHSKEYFDHSAELIVSSKAARRHTAAAYTYTLQAILAADALNIDLARAWLSLANATKGTRLSSDFSSIEAVVVTLEFLNSASMADIDYGNAYEACLENNNVNTLTYACGLDLCGSFLSGRDLRYALETGNKALKWLQYDFSPASKLMIASSIQLAANLSDSVRDAKSLQVLEGIYLTSDDNQHLDDLPPLFAIVYWTNVLACGMAFGAAESEVRPIVVQVYKHLGGGSGTVMMFYSLFLLSWFSISYDKEVDRNTVEWTKKKMLAFGHNHDCVNMVKCLEALEGLRGLRDGRLSFEVAVDGLEEALEALEVTNHHLLRVPIQHAPNRKRLIQGYVQHARSAYASCNAFGLARYADLLFPDVIPKSVTKLSPGMVSSLNAPAPSGNNTAQRSCKFDSGTMCEPAPESQAEASDVGNGHTKETLLERKLSLESVLRSFLVLASERSSEMLIQKVLRILMQINRSEWSCLALLDPTTNTLHLRGAGSYDSINIYDIPIIEASDVCPTTILLSGSVTHKIINTSLPSTSSSVKNLIDREPFFRHSPPKYVMMTPLFVQGRFFGSLVLTGRSTGSSNSTSQVSLLATFAAIALEAHSAYESLEKAVEARTSALEQALAHRQTFISSISHELRTPLYSISGLCAVMQNSTDLTPAQSENLGVIASSAEDLQRIVTAILDMAKLESGGMTAESIPFDLRQALESSLEAVAHISRAKGIELVLENDVSTDPPGRVVGDPHRLRQCLLNLLSNAVKFSRAREGSAYIKVGWATESLDERTDMITINVTDNGIGIPKCKMNRLFHSFSQIDASITRQYGGSGLGLSITRGLARVLGGDCWAESAEGQGSTFYLMVKVKREDSAGETAAQKFQPGPPRTALLLAHKTGTTDVLVKNLGYFNVQTEIISDLDTEQQCVPAPHFLIVDIENVASIRQRLDHIRKWGKASKIIYLVALTEVSIAMEGLALTHESIITKPVKAGALYEATQHLVETKKQLPKRPSHTGSTMDRGYGKKYPMKILYVDDSSVNTMVGKKLLSRFGYNDIDICYDGSQAVSACEKTTYDLVLMDLMMPICDGYSALSQIHASEKTGTPTIVALTANADENTRSRCISSGFDGFLSKPLVIQTLAETLKTTYEARYGIREEEEEDIQVR